MIRAVLPLALAVSLPAAPAAAFAQEAGQPELSLEHRMLLRCSAAFSMVAAAQASGNETGAQYPDMGGSGREFFVRSAARVMDEADLDRTQIEALLSAEAQAIWDEDTLDDIMPVCLRLLVQQG
ncbi:hypothetical protein [Aurantiacibacter gangjinensis]|uniref:Uncharacterized protein n=1 Tax=Aurantiacibacter gangjinensis TaxID=502682 RepID=A0A0G9MR43_9SPHN|nr:hypothetical protein [Aurantiacibacter gangjinensis]APE27791.1 hypothetical protein BMF35_a0962 [Aurantiacibacter gangjinensis]KLE31783.1 hypothetical protein AAW01_09785 [Aurantiacibacter gangjinensis]